MSTSNSTTPVIPEGYKPCCRHDKCIHPDGFVLPATLEYFNRNKSTKDGLSRECRECVKARSRHYYENNKEVFNEKVRRYREENDEVVRERKQRHYNENKKAILEKQKQYYQDNIEEIHERRRRYRQENPETIRAQKRREYLKHAEYIKAKSNRWYYENREAALEQCRAYGQRNKDAIRERNQRYQRENADAIRNTKHQYYQRNAEEIREKNRVWRFENKPKMRSYQNRRRARKLALPVTLTPDDWQRALDYFDGACAVCGRAADFWTVIAQDHWQPLGKGGGTTALNIIPLCHGRKGVPAGESCCNQSKLDKDPTTWLVERFGKRRAAHILKRIEDYFEWVQQQGRG